MERTYAWGAERFSFLDYYGEFRIRVACWRDLLHRDLVGYPTISLDESCESNNLRTNGAIDLGKTNGHYKEEFPKGSVVKIADRSSLEIFKTWKLHHKLDDAHFDPGDLFARDGRGELGQTMPSNKASSRHGTNACPLSARTAGIILSASASGPIRPFLTRAFLGDSLMKHPMRSDFDILVTDEGVIVTFKQTNSRYSFHRLTNPKNIAHVGPVSFAGAQHAGRGTGEYSSDEVQNMAQQIAAEFAQSFRSPLDEALAAIRGERVDNITHLRLVFPASIPRRISSEVTATLGLIQNQDEPD